MLKYALKHLIPDKIYLKYKFKKRVGYNLNLTNPKTYNEKLQWLKIYNRNPAYKGMVDKYDVKAYVASIIGEEYVIPTLGVWNHFDEIDFGSLPNQFVLKCTHDSGGIIICKDKQTLNTDIAKKTINNHLKINHYWFGREWPYKKIKPRIIAEPYLEDSQDEELRDYKFFVFDGIVKAMFVATDRSNTKEETKFDFFDANFQHLDLINGHPNAVQNPHKPQNFELMKTFAEKLSQGIPHVRVDFYEVEGKLYFGEMTFFHWSGMRPFVPFEWDEIFGSWIDIPNSRYRGSK